MALYSSSQPVGYIKRYGGGKVPPNFLLMDGSSLSPILYPALFGVIGYTYTPGSPVYPANFNLPDSSGAVSIGEGTGSYPGATAKIRSSNIIGLETHQLLTPLFLAH